MKDANTPLNSFLNKLQSEGQYWFLRKKTIETLQMSDIAFKLAANRLIKKNRIKRVRGDFYILVPLEYSATGALPASWFIDAFMNYLNQSYYVGLLSAAAIHGAAHQQPMSFQVITNKPMRPITVGELMIEFHYKKLIPSYFFQSTKTASGSMHISTTEITTFDLIRYMNAAGQINNVATILCELGEHLNPHVLADLLKNKDVEISIAQRLGYLLETLKLNIDLNPLQKQLQKEKTINRYLVSGGKTQKIDYNQRWHILVNEQVEPDEL